jgi:hypothetical protein
MAKVLPNTNFGKFGEKGGLGLLWNLKIAPR